MTCPQLYCDLPSRKNNVSLFDPNLGKKFNRMLSLVNKNYSRNRNNNKKNLKDFCVCFVALTKTTLKRTCNQTTNLFPSTVLPPAGYPIETSLSSEIVNWSRTNHLGLLFSKRRQNKTKVEGK